MGTRSSARRATHGRPRDSRSPRHAGARAATGATPARRSLATTGNSSLIASSFPGIGSNVIVNDSLNTVGPIHLEAGKRYYIEAVMKEGGGGDNLDVTWQIPGGPPVVFRQPPIPGEFLAQWHGPQAGDVAVTNQPPDTTVLEGRLAAFTVGETGSQPRTWKNRDRLAVRPVSSSSIVTANR